MAPPLIPIEEKLKRYTVSESGCWEWTGTLDRHGYGKVPHKRGRVFFAHRLSYELHVGAIPNGALVCHLCDNRKCINPSHLFIGSPLDNTRDMIAKGRRYTTIGELHPMRKLDEESIRKIRQMRSSGLTLKQIGDEFGIVFQTVSDIVRGKTWSHVKDGNYATAN